MLPKCRPIWVVNSVFIVSNFYVNHGVILGTISVSSYLVPGNIYKYLYIYFYLHLYTFMYFYKGSKHILLPDSHCYGIFVVTCVRGLEPKIHSKR